MPTAALVEKIPVGTIKESSPVLDPVRALLLLLDCMNSVLCAGTWKR